MLPIVKKHLIKYASHTHAEYLENLLPNCALSTLLLPLTVQCLRSE